MGQADVQAEEHAPAELPGRNERFAVMVALAALAVFLTMRPEPQPVDPDQVATQYLDAAGAQLAAANPDAAAPASTEAPAALASADPTAAPADTTAEETSIPSEAPSASAEPEAPATESEPAVSAPAASADAPEPDAETPSEGGSDLGGVFSDTFDADRDEWSSMTGDWATSDGRLVQSNPEGFDYINQVNVQVPAEYSVTVDLEAVSESLGGGIIVGQPALGSRRGAYLIDFTSEGTFLRWGRYDPDSGAYTYIGGLNVGTNGTGPHTLAVEALTDTTLVYLDDTYIGAFDAIDPGYVGLITSQSAVAFDDFVVAELS